MAFETVCKQSLLYEGELIPCMVGDKEIVIMWPDGGQPKAYEARCPHEDVSLGRGATSTGASCIALPTVGCSTVATEHACNPPAGP